MPIPRRACSPPPPRPRYSPLSARDGELIDGCRFRARPRPPTRHARRPLSGRGIFSPLRRFCSGHVAEIWTTPQKHRKKSRFCEFSHRFNRLSSLSSLSDSAVLQSQGAGVTERIARNTGTHGVFKPPRSLMDAVCFCSVGQDSRLPSGRRGGARGHVVGRRFVATPAAAGVQSLWSIPRRAD